MHYSGLFGIHWSRIRFPYTSRNCIQDLSNCQLDPDPQMNSRSAIISITCSSILAKGCRRERDREGHKKERNLKIPWISLIWLWKWLKNHAVKYHFIERINDLFIPWFNIKKIKVGNPTNNHVLKSTDIETKTILIVIDHNWEGLKTAEILWLIRV